MAPETESLIEYPCDFPIKVLGRTQAGFAQNYLAVTQPPQTGTVPLDAQILWEHRSPPLSRMLEHMLVHSDNHFAEQFMRTLGKVFHRPTLFPLPSFMVKLLFGQMGAEVLLASLRVTPTRLPAGFQFLHPTLESALRAELNLPANS